jgi:5-formyltetrahydrofolate cyclo-ligase
VKKRRENREKNSGRILLNSGELLRPVSILPTLGVKDANPSPKKDKVRRELLEKRLCLPSKTVIKNSKRITSLALYFEPFKKAKSLALYFPIRNEVRTEGIFEGAEQLGKEIYFPRVRGSLLEFLEVDDLSDLKPGEFGIPEPASGADRKEAEDIDLIIVPGVAFDLEGRRMGYGKGYYDRALRRVDRRRLLGLAHDLQVLDSIPAEEGDIGVGFLITESGIIFAHGG